MLQMRLVTTSFRFRSRGTSRAADRRRPAFARAAYASNVEALKLYFYVGGNVSKKTRTAKWGSGAIDALSNRLQVELPGLRGFSASNIKSMRIFYEAWKEQIRQTASAESVLPENSPNVIGRICNSSIVN